MEKKVKISLKMTQYCLSAIVQKIKIRKRFLISTNKYVHMIFVHNILNSY